MLSPHFAKKDAIADGKANTRAQLDDRLNVINKSSGHNMLNDYVKNIDVPRDNHSGRKVGFIPPVCDLC